MAKSLEEHLYRSAQTKEEYLDPSTLKKRLQLIAHGLELHRSTSGGSNSGGGVSNDQNSNSAPSESQQLQQFLQMQGNNMNFGQGQGGMSGNSLGLGNAQGGDNMNQQSSMTAGNDVSMLGLSGGLGDSISSSGIDDNANYQDRMVAQKKKVIRQQQQRLLLLRHASKCKEGPNCKTKFCEQMMTLWKHMKKCRDKNCKTSHCLSSRCVLNHYRICKSQGRVATCEVCGPVMEQIKRQDEGEGMDSSDPLAAKPDPGLPNQAIPQLQQQMSSFGNMQQANNAQAMQQQAMQQLYEKQQQAIQQQAMQQQQNQQMSQMMGMNSMDNIGGNMQNDELQNSQGSQQQQEVQQKLAQQQQVLSQLRKQQQQLLEQQQSLQEQQRQLTDPTNQQAQQLQQQHALLQQLQRRCQQQQALIQQELVMTMKGMQQGQVNQQMGSSQSSQHSQQSQLGSSNPQQMANQSMQGAQLQAQMQALSQSHLEALNNNKDNSMMQVQSGSQDEVEQALMQQGMDGQEDHENEEQLQDEETPDQPVPSSPGDAFSNIAQQLDGDEEKEADKTESSLTKVRTTPAGRGKGARGRGGKGKRLRDIADDLLPAESAAAVRAGASISFPGSGDSGLSKKRSADELGGDADEPALKSSKTDSTGLDPDTETSGDLKDGVDSERKEGDDPNASLASSMPKGDVEQNLMLLHKGLHLTSRTITHKCLPIVQQLIDDPFGWVFRDAVDPVVFGLPDYFEVVKNPMHLLLVKKKLENAVYTDMASFERDVKLVFENAILYNGEDSEVGQLAHTMMGVFEKEYKKVCEGM